MRIFLSGLMGSGKSTLARTLAGQAGLPRFDTDELIVRETGQIGGRSTLKREQYADQGRALAALESARDAQLKRGFQLMFAQGADAPR